MSKRQNSKYKIDRRLGENIWGRPKSPINKRAYGPGQHGQRRKGKTSDYGLQLRAKQKLKGYYGSITEKQFRSSTTKPPAVKGDTGENLIGLLESRLDAVVYRAKFVPTLFAARQFVSHGHVMVNGKRVNIPSYQVQGRRRDRGQGEVQAAGAWCSKPSSSPSATCPTTSRSTTGHEGATFVRVPGAGRRAVPGADGTEPRGRYYSR